VEVSFNDTVGRIDAIAGDAIERTVRAKHRWRLRRLGQAAALDPAGSSLWASGEPPPRDGCQLEVLIDGAEAFPQIADAIAGARHYVHITGWHLAAEFELTRGEYPTVLGHLLAEAAERVDVRVLVWAGAPVPLFHPSRGEVADAVKTLTRGTKIRCEPDPREHPFHCHHEKTLIIDGEMAFVGGIDMTGLAGDRFDTSDHLARRRLGWHDVGTRLRGPAVRDVADHFALRWKELTGEQLEVPPLAPPDGPHTVQVVRTVSEVMYDRVPKGEFRILESYIRALKSAQSYIYIENQFLWSPEIVRIIEAKLKDPPSDDFRVVMVLPSKANNGHDDTVGQLSVLVDADDEDEPRRMLAATLRSLSGNRDDRLYVHAKVGIVDDRWLTVGSANLNAHSLFNDTEMNVATDSQELARGTRLRLWAEHLNVDRAEIADEPVATTVDQRWRPIAAEQLRRQEAGEPPTHRLLELPGVSHRSHRLIGPLSGLLDDG
jgi:phosphatidylserine/phosphatidylglycerophosphate/cardiolipin synthase-like enzyme